jgi:hypothetical protein
MLAGYIPSRQDLAGVAITWAIGTVLLALGTAVCRRSPAPEYRIAAGWGALCLVLTACGVLTPISLRVPLIGLLPLLAAVQVIPRWRVATADWRLLGQMLLFSLPLWAVMAAARPSQVDTFLNLLPNAVYLVDYGRFPAKWLAPSFSFLPAAPYNTQFLAFLGSFADRGFPATGMSLCNVLLTLLAGVAIGRALAAPSRGSTGDGALGWTSLALGLLLATLFNPGFVPRFNFSAYGETSQSVTALLAISLLIAAQQALAEGRRPSQLPALSLILAAMINAKQSGIGLAAAVAGAAFVVGVAEAAVDRAELARSIVLALLPAALVYALWRWYVAHAGVAELTNLPPSAWNWRLLPDTFHSILTTIAEKPLYFAAEAAALALFPALLRRDGWTPTTRALGMNGALLIFYNSFVIVTYVVHFSPEMSREAHSYFRYNIHLSLVLVFALSLAARDLGIETWLTPARRRRAAGLVIAVALLTPFAFAERLRFDLVMPQAYVWGLANRLKPYLHDRDRVALLLPHDDGTVTDILTGYLTDVPPRRRALDIIRRDQADATTLAGVAAAGYDLAVISCTPAGLLGLPAGEAALVGLAAQHWQVIATWRYPKTEPMTRWQRSRSWPALCR